LIPKRRLIMGGVVAVVLIAALSSDPFWKHIELRLLSVTEYTSAKKPSDCGTA